MEELEKANLRETFKNMNDEDFIPIENIIESLKYHIFDSLCKKVGLDKL